MQTSWQSKLAARWYHSQAISPSSRFRRGCTTPYGERGEGKSRGRIFTPTQQAVKVLFPIFRRRGAGYRGRSTPRRQMPLRFAQEDLTNIVNRRTSNQISSYIAPAFLKRTVTAIKLATYGDSDDTELERRVNLVYRENGERSGSSAVARRRSVCTPPRG